MSVRSPFKHARLPEQTPKLPLVNKNSEVDSISCDTMADLIQGKYDSYYSKILTIDCRYAYEYKGGHIINALNINQSDDLDEIYYTFLKDSENTCIIFHCEFSSKRGPKMFHYFRNFDRNRNSSKYPFLNYPEVYVMEGGYRKFYEKYRNLCDPDGYIEMHDPLYAEELKIAHKEYIKNTRKFRSRSCSDLSIIRNVKKLCNRRNGLISSLKINITQEDSINFQLSSGRTINFDEDDELGGENKKNLRSSHSSMPELDFSHRYKYW